MLDGGVERHDLPHPFLPEEAPMQTEPSLEQRLAVVEAAIAEIQQRLASHPLPETLDLVERFTGIFEDEPAFDEVVAYGRAFREADRPQEDETL
jgi:hypothetical protein